MGAGSDAPYLAAYGVVGMVACSPTPPRAPSSRSGASRSWCSTRRSRPAAWGQTAGKRALRLRVLDVASRRPPALIDAVMRVAVLVLPLVVLGLWGRTAWEMGGWLLLVAAPALGRERRCLHDLVARTQVVQLA